MAIIVLVGILALVSHHGGQAQVLPAGNAATNSGQQPQVLPAGNAATNSGQQPLENTDHVHLLQNIHNYLLYLQATIADHTQLLMYLKNKVNDLNYVDHEMAANVTNREKDVQNQLQNMKKYLITISIHNANLTTIIQSLQATVTNLQLEIGAKEIAMKAKESKLELLSQKVANMTKDLSDQAALNSYQDNQIRTLELAMEKQIKQIAALQANQAKPTNAPKPAAVDYSKFGFSKYKSSWYKFVKKSSKWADADFYCQQLVPGARLATIASQDENDFVWNLIKERWGYDRAWLGGHDRDGEGQWKWVNGQAFQFQTWSHGQPDNSGDEDCLDMLQNNGLWNDLDCNRQNVGFVCEINATS